LSKFAVQELQIGGTRLRRKRQPRPANEKSLALTIARAAVSLPAIYHLVEILHNT
jgi:hypothetical protein